MRVVETVGCKVIGEIKKEDFVLIPNGCFFLIRTHHFLGTIQLCHGEGEGEKHGE